MNKLMIVLIVLVSLILVSNCALIGYVVSEQAQQTARLAAYEEAALISVEQAEESARLLFEMSQNYGKFISDNNIISPNQQQVIALETIIYALQIIGLQNREILLLLALTP